MIREVKSVLALGPERDWKVPVVRTEAAKGEGIAELLEAIDAHGARDRRGRARWPSAGPATCAPRCSGSPRRGCAASSSSAPRSDPEWAALLDRVVSREIDPATAARELLEETVMAR